MWCYFVFTFLLFLSFCETFFPLNPWVAQGGQWILLSFLENCTPFWTLYQARNVSCISAHLRSDPSKHPFSMPAIGDKRCGKRFVTQFESALDECNYTELPFLWRIGIEWNGEARWWFHTRETSYRVIVNIFWCWPRLVAGRINSIELHRLGDRVALFHAEEII